VLSGADDLAYLALGTGLAAGFVLSGALRRGAHGAAGEIGHVPVDPAGALCSCGQRGCLELSASGSALSAAWPSEGELPPAVALFAAAAAGNPAAVVARDRYAARVADAIRMLGLAVDPAAIIIGGGGRPRGGTSAGGGHRGAAGPGLPPRRSSPPWTWPAGSACCPAGCPSPRSGPP